MRWQVFCCSVFFAGGEAELHNPLRRFGTGGLRLSAVRKGDSLKKDLKQQCAVQNAAFQLTLDLTEK